MENNNFDYKNIPGWGMDIDEQNEPTYPMKNYTGDDHKRSEYEKPPKQPVDVEILKSTERHAISAVFGNASPPSGLSGMIRRYAFKHSEDRYRHWIPLILADRINAWEGIIDDFRSGNIPNIPAERGWKSEMKYNRAALTKKILVTGVVSLVLLSYLTRRKR
ncbi:hypothetical protein [Pedobacter terrae]|uniref:hypothetical protein n=1 Tax=Pedobacter terrae TaxID=405671 RepID=UPI002FF63FD1